ncbi:hypothetical protein PSEUDO8BK_40547 [Pseudomonas sp. 8BK]|nr:hypothetical protein PSEUDO8BK_40547 [Pseudomonas sp. 8BK]
MEVVNIIFEVLPMYQSCYLISLFVGLTHASASQACEELDMTSSLGCISLVGLELSPKSQLGGGFPLFSIKLISSFGAFPPDEGLNSWYQLFSSFFNKVY